jgi:hypothetical protein
LVHIHLLDCKTACIPKSGGGHIDPAQICKPVNPWSADSLSMIKQGYSSGAIGVLPRTLGPEAENSVIITGRVVLGKGIYYATAWPNRDPSEYIGLQERYEFSHERFQLCINKVDTSGNL